MSSRLSPCPLSPSEYSSLPTADVLYYGHRDFLGHTHQTSLRIAIPVSRLYSPNGNPVTLACL